MFWRSCYCSSQTPHSAAQQSVHFTTSSACTIRRSSRKKHQATASFVLHTHGPATVHLSPSSDAWRETKFSVKLLFLRNLMQCERKNSQSHASSVSVKSENHSQKKKYPACLCETSCMTVHTFITDKSCPELYTQKKKDNTVAKLDKNVLLRQLKPQRNCNTNKKNSFPELEGNELAFSLFS